ncbi:MAG: rod shape-determining protein MreC [Pseudomonadota bacterium]
MARRRASSPLFPRGPGVGARTLLVILLALGIWFADQRGLPLLTAVRGSVDWLLQPLYWAGNLPGNVADAGGELKNYKDLLAENRALKEAQLKAQARLLLLDSLEAENRRIRQLMASSSALDQRVLIAEIVATSQAPYRHQITLNKGAADGVYFGQAIVDAYGVMGQVIRVNPTSSVALLVTDPSHGIPVEVNRTGLQTVARGGGDGRVLSLPFLPGNADVKVGDLLVSSGLGGRFPAGYPVGEIFDIRRTTGEHFMEASAYPSARLNQGRQALLVWSSLPTPVAGEDPTDNPARLAASAAASAQSWAVPGQGTANTVTLDTPLPPLKYGHADKPAAAKPATVAKPKATKPPKTVKPEAAPPATIVAPPPAPTPPPEEPKPQPEAGP